MIFTTDELVHFCHDARPYENGLRQSTGIYHIDTPLRFCHYMATLAHESGAFKHNVENLNYSADRLMQVFPKYFKSLNQAQQYERKPEKIANRVYAGRLGNGPEESGDGWKYRGRGPIQITGKDNYRTCGVKNAVDNPDLLLELLNGCIAAGHFWNSRNINSAADADDVVRVCKLVNGGTQGLDDRKGWLVKSKGIWL